MNLWPFRKMPQLHYFQKIQKMFHGLGQDFSCIKFLVLKSVTSRHCSNDRKEANILDRCGLPLNWGGGGGGGGGGRGKLGGV